MKKVFGLFLFTLAVSASVFAQIPCRTTEYKTETLLHNPSLEGHIGNGRPDVKLVKELKDLTGIITIPIVIHVVYNENVPEERIPTALLQAQVEQVNKDFSATNDDRILLPDGFKKSDGKDSRIRFKLDSIRYIKTKKDGFVEVRDLRDNVPDLDQIKFSDLGGDDGYSDMQFLNVWIGNITDLEGNKILGYSTYPGGIDKFDGVVIDYTSVGPVRDSTGIIHGRTLTHEIGHWLNLYHLWGEEDCGDDFVEDTPKQQTANFDIPDFPHYTCDDKKNGDMFMNFMDYTPDRDRVFFTTRQVDRMRLNFLEGGRRSSFLTNTSYNILTLIDTSDRKDQNTPVISYVSDFRKSGILKGKTIRWKNQDGAVKYNIQARVLDGSGWNKSQTTNVPKITLNNLVQGKTYEIWVQAVDANGDTTTKSRPYVFVNSSKISAAKTKTN